MADWLPITSTEKRDSMDIYAEISRLVRIRNGLVTEDEEITPYDLWDAFTTPEEALAAIQEEIERIKK